MSDGVFGFEDLCILPKGRRRSRRHTSSTNSSTISHNVSDERIYIQRAASAQSKARAKGGMDKRDLGRHEKKTDYGLLFFLVRTCLAPILPRASHLTSCNARLLQTASSLAQLRTQIAKLDGMNFKIKGCCALIILCGYKSSLTDACGL